MNAQRDFFAALLDPRQPCPAGLTTWNQSDPAVRFAVYRNNVAVKQVDALADTFAVTQELVGKEFFRTMARLYVRARPPRSPVLAFYGMSFPAFIEAFVPAASVPYLADVATLEWLRLCACHAADAAAITAEAIGQAQADIDGLPDARIAFHPSVGLLRSRYAVVSLWAAHQGVGELSAVDPDVPETALIVRPGLDVEVTRVDAAAGEFIARLLQGASLAAAAGLAADTHPDFDLADALGLLLRQHAIASLNTERRVQA